MSWTKLNNEDVSEKEINDLYPTYGLFNGVNYSDISYYRDDNGKLWEVSVSIDGSLTERIEQLEKVQKARELLSSFGI